jgi:hypothetical protein
MPRCASQPSNLDRPLRRRRGYPRHVADRPDTEGEVHSVQLHHKPNAAEREPVDGLIRTRYTLEVCVVCGHERVHTPTQQTSCPECGG